MTPDQVRKLVQPLADDAHMEMRLPLPVWKRSDAFGVVLSSVTENVITGQPQQIKAAFTVGKDDDERTVSATAICAIQAIKLGVLVSVREFVMGAEAPAA